MAEEYIKRSGAVNALQSLPTWWADGGGVYGDAKKPMEALLYPEDAVSAIENIPSEDVVEVVRCKDCRFHTTDPECFDEFEITDKPMMCVGIRYGVVDPDWFCEHGERMVGGR